MYYNNDFIDELGWNHTLGICEDSYDAIQDLLLTKDSKNYYEEFYHCDDLYDWVELIKGTKDEILLNNCIEIVSQIYDILFKYLDKAKSNRVEIKTLNDLFNYMAINYPMELKEVKSKINYIDSIVK